MKQAHTRKKPLGTSLFGDDLDELYDRIWSPCWIKTKAGRAGLDHLERIYKQPKSHRPQCCLIVGEPAAGKTTLARQFVRTVNPSQIPGEEGTCMPVVYVQSPPKADAAALYTNILREVDAPYQATWQVARKQDQVLRLLTNLKTRMLMIDELHCMLAGHFNDRNVYMNVLKFLSNELQIPLVGIGTRDVHRAIQTDQQFGNRFEPYVIESFKPDKEYVRFMVQVCKHANFDDVALLHKSTFVRRVHTMTKGLTGETWNLICRLIYFAETEGNRKLKMNMLDQIEWVMPAQRRRAAL